MVSLLCHVWHEMLITLLMDQIYRNVIGGGQVRFCYGFTKSKVAVQPTLIKFHYLNRDKDKSEFDCICYTNLYSA